MKVFHIVPGISRQGGGPSRSSQGLVGALHDAGVDAWLMTLSHGESPWIRGCEQFINGGVFEDALARVKPDLVHLHGIWDPRLHRCAVICRRWHIPYIIAPRGMLEPWSLKTKWLKKRIARFLYQDLDLHKAVALHATAESEAAQFRKLGFKNPIIISPNGVNLPKSTPTPKTYTSDEKRRALFVSRMHPKKGVLELVESWSRVFSHGEHVERGDWVCELVYTLNGDTERAYEQQVKERILALGMSYQDKDGTIHCQPQPPTSTSLPDFIFTGPLNDNDKWQAYARADLFVLPTYSENFGIVVAEALWAEVPVITTKGTPWSELEGEIHSSTSTQNFNSANGRCGWWIDLPPTSSLDSALREATSTSASDLNLLGQRGHALIQEKYTWPSIAKTMIAGYKEVLHVS